MYCVETQYFQFERGETFCRLRVCVYARCVQSAPNSEGSKAQPGVIIMPFPFIAPPPTISQPSAPAPCLQPYLLVVFD